MVVTQRCLEQDLNPRPTDRTRLTASFPGQPGQLTGTGKVKPISILTKQQMIRWQWHQLNRMQTIYTSLQTDNHASTMSASSVIASRMLFLTPNQQC